LRCTGRSPRLKLNASSAAMTTMAAQSSLGLDGEIRQREDRAAGVGSVAAAGGVLSAGRAERLEL